MQNCYVIQRPDGAIYISGQWVTQPPFEVFVPVIDTEMVENIAQGVGGRLVELEELEAQAAKIETESKAKI